MIPTSQYWYYNPNASSRDIIKPTEAALVLQMLKKDGKSCASCITRNSEGKCTTKHKYVQPYAICEYHNKVILK